MATASQTPVDLVMGCVSAEIKVSPERIYKDSMIKEERLVGEYVMVGEGSLLSDSFIFRQNSNNF
jgi:hypothetical protein